MRKVGLQALLVAAVFGLIAALLFHARADAQRAFPDLAGPALVILIAACWLTWGVFALWAAPNLRAAEGAARVLRVRLAPTNSTTSPGLLVASPAFATLGFGVIAAFFWSLYPASWDEAWVCEACRNDDGVCCDLTGGATPTILFILSLFGAFAAIGGIIAGVIVLRSLAQSATSPPIVVEVSTTSALPGEAIRVRVELRGVRRGSAMQLRLEREEEALETSGSSSTRHKEVVESHVVATRERQLFDGPVDVFEREFVIPATAMHSFDSANNSISWRLVLEAHAGLPWQAWPIQVRSRGG